MYSQGICDHTIFFLRACRDSMKGLSESRDENYIRMQYAGDDNNCLLIKFCKEDEKPLCFVDSLRLGVAKWVYTDGCKVDRDKLRAALKDTSADYMIDKLEEAGWDIGKALDPSLKLSRSGFLARR